MEQEDYKCLTKLSYGFLGKVTNCLVTCSDAFLESQRTNPDQAEDRRELSVGQGWSW